MFSPGHLQEVEEHGATVCLSLSTGFSGAWQSPVNLPAPLRCTGVEQCCFSVMLPLCCLDGEKVWRGKQGRGCLQARKKLKPGV